MKINIDNKNIIDYATNGENNTVKNIELFSFFVIYNIFGIGIYIESSLLIALLFTLPILILFVILCIYIKIKYKMTNGYNFLIIGVSCAFLSFVSLILSTLLNYNRTKNIWYIIILLLIYILSTLLCYTINILILKKYSNRLDNSPVKKNVVPSVCAVLASLVFSSKGIIDSVEQDRLAIIMSVVLFVLSIITMIGSLILIKFILLVKIKNK